MNPCDDTDLIDRLQSGIAERTSGISAPHGIGEQARRAARRRTATRAVGAGVPVLAAAGVVTVLATGSGAGPTAAQGGSPRAANRGSAHAAPAVSGGPVRTEDTAYILRRVHARIAEDGPSGFVIHAVDYTSGSVSSDGSLVNLGSPRSSGWDYSAPDGTLYQRNAGDGSYPGVTGIGVTGPVIDGHQRTSLTLINAKTQTYSQQVTVTAVPADAASEPATGVGLGSSGSAVQQALQNGQVTQLGTTAVDGTPAIALSVTLPSDDDLDYTLYVDAQTYQPLRTVTVGTSTDNATTYIADLEPSTPANIAQAEDDSIPAGYTKVDHPAG